MCSVTDAALRGHSAVLTAVRARLRPAVGRDCFELHGSTAMCRAEVRHRRVQQLFQFGQLLRAPDILPPPARSLN